MNPWNGIKVIDRMEQRGKGEMRKGSEVSYVCLLLALLKITTPSSAQNPTSATAAAGYLSRPDDITVAVGEPAIFHCGVPEASPNITFTFYGGHGNYSLTCPQGHVEDILQTLYGSCDLKKGESLAVWTLKGTSLSDNNTRVACQWSDSPEAPSAILHVYDNGIGHTILIGCVIGGFFGTLLVAGLLYLMLQRSETLQKCYRGKETEDDLSTIITKD